PGVVLAIAFEPLFEVGSTPVHAGTERNARTDVGRGDSDLGAQRFTRFSHVIVLIPALGCLLSPQRDQHADHDHANLAEKPSPAMKRPRQTKAHALLPLAANRGDHPPPTADISASNADRRLCLPRFRSPD